MFVLQQTVANFMTQSTFSPKSVPTPNESNGPEFHLELVKYMKCESIHSALRFYLGNPQCTLRVYCFYYIHSSNNIVCEMRLDLKIIKVTGFLGRNFFTAHGYFLTRIIQMYSKRLHNQRV